MPVRMKYDLTITVGGEQTYGISSEVTITKPADIIYILDHHTDGVAHQLKAVRQPKLSMGPVFRHGL